MKQVLKLVFLLQFIIPVKIYAQEGFKKGFVITLNDEKSEGSIKGFLKSKGTIVFLSSDGKKSTISAGTVKSFSIDSTNYAAFSNDFYKEITGGAKATLYKRETDNSNIPIYNGTEMVGYTKTMDGKKGDYYVWLSTEKKLSLVTEKSFESFFTSLFINDSITQTAIKNKTLGYKQIIKVI
jgi:hypothetical protein